MAGFKPTLLLAGYVWDHSESLGMAHISCATRALAQASKEAAEAAK